MEVESFFSMNMISAHKKEENRVEEQREKVKSLQHEYEENMRGINEKLESKSKPKKNGILTFLKNVILSIKSYFFHLKVFKNCNVGPNP